MKRNGFQDGRQSWSCEIQVKRKQHRRLHSDKAQFLRRRNHMLNRGDYGAWLPAITEITKESVWKDDGIEVKRIGA